MNTEFNLISDLHNKTLVIKTEGYINNVGVKKLYRNFLNILKLTSLY